MEIQHILGYNAIPHSSVLLSENVILHPAGQKVLIKELNGVKNVKVLKCKHEIQCLAVCPESRYLAVSERSERKTEISKGKHIPAAQISIFDLSGGSSVKVWKIGNDAITSMPSIPNLSVKALYSDHCWTEKEEIITVTEDGDVFVIKGGFVVQRFEEIHGENRGLFAATRFGSKGFLVGGDEALISMFWINPNSAENRYHQVRKVTTTYTFYSRINDLTICRADTQGKHMVAICYQNNIAFVPLQYQEGVSTTTSGKKSIENSSNTDIEVETITSLSLLYKHGVHAGPITSMDICASKRILASCSTKDRSVRIWDFDINETKCRIVKTFLSETEAPVDLSIHPSGHLLAICLKNKVLQTHILQDSLANRMELTPRRAHAVSYNKGGNLLIVSCNKAFRIYDTYQGFLVSHYSSHTLPIQGISWSMNDHGFTSCGAGGHIYEWSFKEAEHKQKTPLKEAMQLQCSRMNEYHDEHLHFDSVSYGINNGVTALAYNIKSGFGSKVGVLGHFNGNSASNSHSSILHWEAGSMSNDEDAPSRVVKIDLPDRCLKMSVVGKTLIVGSANGAVQICRDWDRALKRAKNDNDDQELMHLREEGKTNTTNSGETPFDASLLCHVGGTSSLAVPPFIDPNVLSKEDGSLRVLDPSPKILYSGGEDGVIFMFKIEGTKMNSFPQPLNHTLRSDDNVCTVLTDHVERLGNELNSLQIQLHEAHTQYDYEKTNLLKDHTDAIDSVKLSLQNLKGSSRRTEKELRDSLEKLERQRVSEISSVERKHMEAANELESLYEKKLDKYKERCKQLEEDLYNEQQRREETRHVLKKEASEIEKKFLADIVSKTEEHNQQRKELGDYVDHLRKQYAELIDQIEAEHDKEVIGLRAKINSERETASQLHDSAIGEHAILKRKIEDLQETIAKKEKDLNFSRRQRQKSDETRERMEKELDDLRTRYANIDDIIASKDTQCNQMNAKIGEMERLHNLLKHQLRVSRQQIGPKDAKIVDMLEQIDELDKEYENTVHLTATMEDEIKNLKLKLSNATSQLGKAKTSLLERNQLLHNFAQDINNLVQNVAPSSWKDYLSKVDEKYLSSGICFSDDVYRSPEETSLEEYHRQRMYTESMIRKMNQSNAKLNVLRDREKNVLIGQNTELMNEINELRKEKSFLAKQLHETKTKMIAEKIKNESKARKMEKKAQKATLATTQSVQQDRSGDDLGDQIGSLLMKQPRKNSKVRGRGSLKLRKKTPLQSKYESQRVQKLQQFQDEIEQKQKAIDIMSLEIKHLRNDNTQLRDMNKTLHESNRKLQSEAKTGINVKFELPPSYRPHTISQGITDLRKSKSTSNIT
eukprot:g2770.t1